jgi:hypothetical protein
MVFFKVRSHELFAWAGFKPGVWTLVLPKKKDTEMTPEMPILNGNCDDQKYVALTSDYFMIYAIHYSLQYILYLLK